MSDRQEANEPKRVGAGPLLFVAAAMVLAFVAVAAIVFVAQGSGNDRAAVRGQPHHMAAAHVNPMAGRGQLEVLVGDYWFKPSSHRMHAGVYRFSAHNYGGVQHDVMIERMPIKFSAPGAPVDEAAPYGVDDLQPGMTKSTRVMLTAGRWEIFCSVAGHYQAGQHQVIDVYGQMPRGMKAPQPMGMGNDGGGGGDMGDQDSSGGGMGMGTS